MIDTIQKSGKAKMIFVRLLRIVLACICGLLIEKTFVGFPPTTDSSNRNGNVIAFCYSLCVWGEESLIYPCPKDSPQYMCVCVCGSSFPY